MASTPRRPLEKDIDYLIADALACEPGFGRSFAAQMGIVGRVVQTEVSVREERSESDLTIIIEGDDGVLHLCHAENKIKASLSVGQAKGYAWRARVHGTRLGIASIHTMLIAPAAYLARCRHEVFQHVVSYEYLADELERSENPYSAKHAATLRRCLAKVLPAEIEDALARFPARGAVPVTIGLAGISLPHAALVESGHLIRLPGRPGYLLRAKPTGPTIGGDNVHGIHELTWRRNRDFVLWRHDNNQLSVKPHEREILIRNRLIDQHGDITDKGRMHLSAFRILAEHYGLEHNERQMLAA